jgi:hypothetical protein
VPINPHGDGLPIPRWLRRYANILADRCWPGTSSECTRKFVRADIRDAYIQGWIDGSTTTKEELKPQLEARSK